MSSAGLTDWYTGSLQPSVPVVLSAPHGGAQCPLDILERSSGCVCEDAGSLELARAIRAEFGRRLGAVPHLVASQLHRTKLDANRGRDSAAEAGARGALAAWDCYHGWIREALDEVVTQHGFALLLDIHGQDHRPDASELGYALSAVELLGDDASLDGDGTGLFAAPASSLGALLQHSSAAGTGPTLSSLVRGPDSLGSLLERHGYAATPSASRPVPVSEESLRATLSAALGGTARGGSGQEAAVKDGLAELLVRHGYAESALHAAPGAAALLPYAVTQQAQQAQQVQQAQQRPGVWGGDSVAPPAVGGRGVGDGSASAAVAGGGVYFGGAYTVRCYGVGAEAVVAVQIEAEPRARLTLHGQRDYATVPTFSGEYPRHPNPLEKLLN